jgi:hypothetical protein
MKNISMDVSFYNSLVALVEKKNNKIQILSGEGDCGNFEIYTGKRTMRAIKMRLTKERCGGDRWARAMVFSHTVHDAYGFCDDIYYDLETGDGESLPHED